MNLAPQTIKSRYAQFLLLLLWVIVQGFLLARQGVFTGEEAEKYIYEATHLLNEGRFSEKKYFFYVPTTLLIAFAFKTGIGPTGVVMFQLLFNGLSTIWLYQIARKLSMGSDRLAFITTILFITWYPLQMWNSYLFTESLFFSIIIGFTWLLVYLRTWSFKNTSLWIIGLILTVIARPFGLLFIPAFLLYIHVKVPSKLRYLSFLFIIAGCFCFIYFVNFVFTGGSEMNAMKPFIEEHTICLLPDTSYHPPLVLSDSRVPVNQIIYYIFNNPTHFLKLAAKRLIAFYGLYRPYYSLFHNAYLVGSIFFIYSFALYGLRRFIQYVPIAEKAFILTSIIVYSFAITFQCDDYHNRFIMAIFPYLFLLAAFGIDKLLWEIRKQREPNFRNQ